MNPVIMVARNNLHLTKAGVKSVREQDVPTSIIVVDNGSTDNTARWLQSQPDIICSFQNNSVAGCWNSALTLVFDEAEHALVINNDVELPPWLYRTLLEDGGLFVTAIGVHDRSQVREPDLSKSRRYHPDFSCFLIRKEVWDKVGPFDEDFKGAYCEDQDYDCRMFQAGIRSYCLDAPYFHHVSSTVKNADPEEARLIHERAQRNREYFQKKWGFAGGSPEYYAFMQKDEP